MAKPRTGKYYFTEETEQAIIRYNASTDLIERNRIYDAHIRPAFDKLVENMIHTFKFYHFDVPYEDVKHEVIAFLNEKMSKFTAGKGKAFSYFSIVAKNYLIVHNNNNFKKSKNKEELEIIDERRNLTNEVHRADFKDMLHDFVEQFIAHYDTNLNRIFSTAADIQVADSVIEIFKIRENIELFNKKALYILIRERCGYKTNHITKIVNFMRDDFKRKYTEYMATGRFISEFDRTL